MRRFSIAASALAVAALLFAVETCQGEIIVLSTGTSASNSNTITGFSTTANTGLLVVGYANFRGSASATVTGATFNGTAMIPVAGSTATDDRLLTTFFVLPSPGAVTGNIVVAGPSTNYQNVVAYSLQGTSSISNILVTAHNNVNNASSVTTSISPLFPSLLIDMLATDDATSSSVTNTVGAGQTEVLNARLSTAADRFSGSSYKSVGAGSQSMSWTFGLTITDNEGGAHSVLAVMVPEPSTLAMLLGLGGTGLLGWMRRRRS